MLWHKFRCWKYAIRGRQQNQKKNSSSAEKTIAEHEKNLYNRKARTFKSQDIQGSVKN